MGTTGNFQPTQTGVSVVTYSTDFAIVNSGLKPSTVHRFYYAGIDHTANCIINPAALTYGTATSNGAYMTANGLLSDSQGKISFHFHLAWPSTDNLKQKVLTIEAPNSYASNTITLKA